MPAFIVVISDAGVPHDRADTGQWLAQAGTGEKVTGSGMLGAAFKCVRYKNTPYCGKHTRKHTGRRKNILYFTAQAREV